MDVSQISTSTAAMAATVQQAQTRSEVQLDLIKNDAENQQQIVQLLDEATGKGQKINVTI
jgi:hypothetical protein